MIERLLRIIFENEDVPSYKSLPDVKDCEFAIGYYCEQMIRNEQYYFGSKQFYDRISDFCKMAENHTRHKLSFYNITEGTGLFVKDMTLGFRFAFWVYYLQLCE